MTQAKKPQQVYTLLVQVGRRSGDGLPDDCAGAGLLCYASGVDEDEAVRETVAILRQADLAPLDVTGYGTLAERLAEGHEIDDEERALMQRAHDENSVIVAQMTPFGPEEGLAGDLEPGPAPDRKPHKTPHKTPDAHAAPRRGRRH